MHWQPRLGISTAESLENLSTDARGVTVSADRNQPLLALEMPFSVAVSTAQAGEMLCVVGDVGSSETLRAILSS